MLKMEEGIPIEDDPSFVLLRVAKEMSNWFAESGGSTDRDKTYRDLVDYFHGVLHVSENMDVSALSGKRRKAVEYGLAWLEYSKGGADGVAAFLWLEARRLVAEREDAEIARLMDLATPMTVDVVKDEYILSVDTAEDAQRVWEKCADALRDTLEEVTGRRMRVMLWDDDFGIWGDEAA
ncbi:MAG: hypothetical protein OXD31_00645 [Chloroflexi bacterium]|nr:hypothetical protein [Chloroflexota bacterium]